ncbi:hypothetical protein PR048_004524 [Dryococelus australis]|uniref:Uncharacterized protein n=1 Tax=Dryococelus australis TaxID=614101 RepID=A0ABQ9I5P3_9NEOP|nr:hypothetical protein PR048_004524 [Dryococelus australis]
MDGMFKFHYVKVDKTCDTSKHEQVTFCIQSVDENLTISEDFVGLYETPNLEGKTLFWYCEGHSCAHLCYEQENLKGCRSLLQICSRRPFKCILLRIYGDPLKKYNSSKISEKMKKIGLRPLCTTRWTMRASNIQQVLINYERLAESFETYSEDYSSDAASNCAG